MMSDFNVGDFVEIVKPTLWHERHWRLICKGTHRIKIKQKCGLNNGYYFYYGIELKTIFGDSKLVYFTSEELCLIDRITSIDIEEII